MSIDCVSVCCGLQPHVSLLQVMKYEDLLNWKNKCFGKILLCKAKLTGFCNDHYLWWGEGKQGEEDGTAHPVQHFSCNKIPDNGQSVST